MLSNHENRLDDAILMSTHNIHFPDKVGKILKMSLNFCFLELSEAMVNELATVNESSVKESLRFFFFFFFFFFLYTIFKEDIEL